MVKRCSHVPLGRVSGLEIEFLLDGAGTTLRLSRDDRNRAGPFWAETIRCARTIRLREGNMAAGRSIAGRLAKAKHFVKLELVGS